MVKIRPYDVASKFLKDWKVRNGEIEARICPFCKGGKNKDEHTFYMNVQTGSYICHRGKCGAKGDLKSLLNHFGVNKNEYYGASGDVKSYVQEKHYELPKLEYVVDPTQNVYNYFSNRGISKETVDYFKIMSNIKNGFESIAFPFYNDDQIIFVKYRPMNRKSSKGKKMMKEYAEENTKSILFGMEHITDFLSIVITEGQIDTMSLYQAGVKNVVSVPMGNQNTEWIETCWEWLEKFDRIIFFGDNDEPGKKMVSDAIKRLDPARCYIVSHNLKIPDKDGYCKDANDILIHYGPEKLYETYETYKPVPVKGLVDLSTVDPATTSNIQKIKTNIPSLDKKLGGLGETEVTVFTGKSGDGKSTLSGMLLLSAIEQGWNVCAYSGELSKEHFQEWIHLQAAGPDYVTLKYDKIRGIEVPYVPDIVSNDIRKAYKGKFFLFDNNEVSDISQTEDILRVFKIAATRYGAKMFLVDNLMTALMDEDEELRAQAFLINKMKQFARTYGGHVLIVAHPRKTRAGDSLRKDDVSGNSAITNLADNVIAIERPDIRILKNRGTGEQDLIACEYCPASRRIHEIEFGDMFKFSWNINKIPPLKNLARDNDMYLPTRSETSQPPF